MPKSATRLASTLAVVSTVPTSGCGVVQDFAANVPETEESIWRQRSSLIKVLDFLASSKTLRQDTLAKP